MKYLIDWTKLTPKNISDKSFDEDGSLFLAGSPVGPMINDEYHPLNIFNIYSVDTNFNVSSNSINAICNLDGVELVKPVSKYKFLVGIGSLFIEEDVKKKIEFVLCGANFHYIQLEKLNGDQEVKTLAKSKIKELSSYLYWAILVLPNGQIDECKSDDETEYKLRFSDLLIRKEETNGLLISSDRFNDNQGF